MEVQVEVYAKNPNQPEPRRVASSYLVYVKLGPNGRPGEVPPWTPQTTTQIQRAELADVRREIREREELQALEFKGSSEPVSDHPQSEL